jgi:Spy/CpxP family protein refolding chaperone
MAKSLFAALLLCSVTALPTAVFAQSAATAPPQGPAALPPPGPYGMPGPGYGTTAPRPPGRDMATAALPPVPPPFAGIRFTAEQRQAIGKMMAREREAHQGRIAAMQRAQQQLQQLYQADLWDAQAILALYDEIFAQQRRTIEAMAESRNRIHAMLSTEQRAQLKRIQQQRLQRNAPLLQPHP